MTLKTLDSLFTAMKYVPEPDLDDFSWLFRLRYGNRFESIKSLEVATIGSILEATHASKPSVVFELINRDLKLQWLTQNDKVCLFYLIHKQLRTITELIAAIDEIHPIRNKYADTWNKIASEFAVSSDVVLIDRLAKRNGCDWKSAEKLLWSQVYLMLKIDAQNAAFEAELNKKLMK